LFRTSSNSSRRPVRLLRVFAQKSKSNFDSPPDHPRSSAMVSSSAYVNNIWNTRSRPFLVVKGYLIIARYTTRQRTLFPRTLDIMPKMYIDSRCHYFYTTIQLRYFEKRFDFSPSILYNEFSILLSSRSFEYLQYSWGGILPWS